MQQFRSTEQVIISTPLTFHSLIIVNSTINSNYRQDFLQQIAQQQSTQEMKSKKIFMVFLYLFAGVLSTFAYKLQGSQLVNEGEHSNKKFFHPYMQSLTMFIGQAFCLIVYFSRGRKVRLELEPGKEPHRWYIFAIPALSDSLSSSMQYMGLFFISGSTYMMFKGGTIVTTALFSKLLFGMIIEKRHVAGCGLAVLGLVFVGGSGFLDSTGSGQQAKLSQKITGYILMLTSLVFNGFLYAFEQRLLRKHTIHPLEMVGSEGCFGIIFISIIVTIMSFIECNFGVSGCVFDSQNQGFMQIPSVYLSQVFGNMFLVCFVIAGIITISVYNFAGVSVTKLFDALTRALLNVTKTAFVWAFGIIITLFATVNQYKLESLNVWVNLVKIVGFCCIISGTLIYNQLLFKRYFQVLPEESSEKYSMIIEETGILSDGSNSQHKGQ